ncbi:alkaline phosphatase/alkaline phosphatase D [Azospirillum lipoferum]|uniref:Alkaline phosphatase n=1 Tax=Azospirillum lipoferum TaxID=193 RepID=A0A5A9GNL5_AZOLI|nr:MULTISPECIES: alkaline phosphatase D family protein [Azospirillum]KAA0596031.1 alkaline phosphatase [Azospirillum lipoferum]MCP1610951.1 alkaline phosphatase/alkaline phosphatase D [Azospirillum lipoferum]MDW5533911.1 alkaline phosphatase D family protein [Azospirillum sp. NL1]
MILNKKSCWPMSRRALLKGTSFLAAGAFGSGLSVARPAWAATDAAETIATLISGEPTPTSIVLQVRLSPGLPPVGVYDSPTPGLPAQLRFEVSEMPEFHDPLRTAWQEANEEEDYVTKTTIHGLKPHTKYFYRVEVRKPDNKIFKTKQVGSFWTLANANDDIRVSFAVFSCLNYEKFYGIVKGGGGGEKDAPAWSLPAEGRDWSRGYPVMDVIREKKVQFMVATGDTVYYDPRQDTDKFRATTTPQMRASWHKQFAVPSLRDALAEHGTFWMIDDHDFRFDDADGTGERLPSPADGKKIFHEQVPAPKEGPTYRTYPINRCAQIWVLDGREYRSPNKAPDTPDKSLWGVEQREWLEKTLRESKAPFKIIITPSPIIGPDDAKKSDNQTNFGGFRREGETFLEFLHGNNLVSSTVIITGDRHWQYHSIHPTGVEEFACGTAHRQNSRYGVKPGQGTDPEGRIRQPYLMAEPEGGFIEVAVEPGSGSEKATLVIRLWNETGLLRHEVRRVA